jgi:hypothetical protein
MAHARSKKKLLLTIETLTRLRVRTSLRTGYDGQTGVSNGSRIAFSMVKGECAYTDTCWATDVTCR